MLRCIVVAVGLLAALPTAIAGEMTADEARQFVIGKMFNYARFEGTRGQARVNFDGSVTGSVQFKGSGPVRAAQLPPNTLQVRGGSVCASLPGLPLQRKDRARPWWSGATNSKQMRLSQQRWRCTSAKLILRDS